MYKNQLLIKLLTIIDKFFRTSFLNRYLLPSNESNDFYDFENFDLSSSTPATINSLRQAFFLQRMHELDMKGVNYD